MRRFFLHVALLLALLWLADFAVGAALAHLFHDSPGQDADRLGRAFDYRAPIVVCGSSRVEHHYMVDSLEAELGVRAWNLGQPKSWGALYQYGSAAIVLRHYVPRLWIMEVEPGTYAFPERMDHLVSFVPYVNEEPAAAALLNLRSPWEPVKRLSRIYPYNSLVVDLLTPYVKHPQLRHGYVPLLGTVADDPMRGLENPEPVPDHPAPDTLKMRYLRKTIALLRAHHVAIIAVRSPYWPPNDDYLAIDVRVERDLREVFGELGVRYFDFSPRHNPEFLDPHLFRDVAHLNESGALRFTRALADSIRSLPEAATILSPEAP
jgi:hypothetical protein